MQIFNNQYQKADIWDMQGAIINFGGDKNLTMGNTFDDQTVIAVNLQLGYGRQVTPRYPINVRRVIYTLGTPSGTLSMGMLFGPHDALQTFFNLFAGGKPEKAAVGGLSSVIKIKPFGTVIRNSEGQTNVTWNNNVWTITSPVLSSVGLTIQESGNAAIPVTGNVQMVFQDLQYGDDKKIKDN